MLISPKILVSPQNELLKFNKSRTRENHVKCKEEISINHLTGGSRGWRNRCMQCPSFCDGLVREKKGGGERKRGKWSKKDKEKEKKLQMNDNMTIQLCSRGKNTQPLLIAFRGAPLDPAILCPLFLTILYPPLNHQSAFVLLRLIKSIYSQLNQGQSSIQSMPSLMLNVVISGVSGFPGLITSQHRLWRKVYAPSHKIHLGERGGRGWLLKV